jgi:hypothetical protein
MRINETYLLLGSSLLGGGNRLLGLHGLLCLSRKLVGVLDLDKSPGLNASFKSCLQNVLLDRRLRLKLRTGIT